MKFGFYSKHNPDREIINSGIFRDSHTAAAVFAAMKGLSIDTFLDLFNITILSDGKF